MKLIQLKATRSAAAAIRDAVSTYWAVAGRRPRVMYIHPEDQEIVAANAVRQVFSQRNITLMVDDGLTPGTARLAPASQ